MVKISATACQKAYVREHRLYICTIATLVGRHPVPYLMDGLEIASIFLLIN